MQGIILSVSDTYESMCNKVFTNFDSTIDICLKPDAVWEYCCHAIEHKEWLSQENTHRAVFHRVCVCVCSPLQIITAGVPLRLFYHDSYWFVATTECWDIARGGPDTQHIYEMFVNIVCNMGYSSTEDFFALHDESRVWCYTLQFPDDDESLHAASSLWCSGSLETGMTNIYIWLHSQYGMSHRVIHTNCIIPRTKTNYLTCAISTCPHQM